MALVFDILHLFILLLSLASSQLGDIHTNGIKHVIHTELWAHRDRYTCNIKKDGGGLHDCSLALIYVLYIALYDIHQYHRRLCKDRLQAT